MMPTKTRKIDLSLISEPIPPDKEPEKKPKKIDLSLVPEPIPPDKEPEKKPKKKRVKQKREPIPSVVHYKPSTRPIPLSTNAIAKILSLDPRYCEQPIGQHPQAVDHALIGLAVAAKGSTTVSTQVGNRLLKQYLNLDDYIFSGSSYYFDPSGFFVALARVLNTSGYVSKTNGDWVITEKGLNRIKTEGLDNDQQRLDYERWS